MQLEDYRKRIDEVDDKLISLLEQRMGISCEIAEFKARENIPTVDDGREKVKLFEVANKTGNPLYKEHMKKIFETVMEQSRSLQDELR